MTATVSTTNVPCTAWANRTQYWLTVPCPNGWDDVLPLTGKVLEFEGRTYQFRSWNSDRNEAYFLATETAKIC